MQFSYAIYLAHPVLCRPTHVNISGFAPDRQLTQTFKKGWTFALSVWPGKLNYINLLYVCRFLTKSNQKAVLKWLSKQWPSNNNNRQGLHLVCLLYLKTHKPPLKKAKFTQARKPAETDAY